MAKKKLAKVQDIPGMKIYDGPDGPEMCATDKRGGWPDLYMISLNELGLGDDVDKRIWEAMLPQMRKHLGGEPSIFDGIQYRGQFDAYSEAGNALLESAVIDPCLDEYWELNEKGAYTAEWTENEVREFKEKMKARWSYMMEIAYRAMNGTLDENPGKTLDESGERDFKIMCLLCGKTTAQDVSAPADDNNSFPDLPF